MDNIKSMPYRFDKAINIYKNNNNYDNFLRRKNKKYRNINFRNKIRDLTENISGIYNKFNHQNNNHIKKNNKDLDLKIINAPEDINNSRKQLNINTDNYLIKPAKRVYNSANQSRKQSLKDYINLNDENLIKNKLRNKGSYRNYSYNNTDNNSETLAKIIIDKEIKNKNLEEEINNLKNGYDKIFNENENLKKLVDNNDIKKYKSDIILLNKRKEEDEEKYKELENNNKELLCRIKKFKDMEINYNSLKDENLETKNENNKLKNKMKLMKNDYKKIISLNDECKDNFNSIVVKYNDLLDKHNSLKNENDDIKNELNKIKKNYDKLNNEYINNNTQLTELINNDNININKYKKLNEQYMLIKDEYDELKEKYNSLKKEKKNLNEVNKENEYELNDLNQKNDINLRNIDNLKNKINMLKIDYNELNKKYLHNQDILNDIQSKYKELDSIYQKTIKKIYILENEKKDNDEIKEKYNKLLKENNKLKNENNLLIKENEDLINNNKILLKDNKKYKEKKDELNEEIISLRKKIEIYEKEIEEIKRDNKNQKSFYEDEIVIINKEFTYNQGGAFGGEYKSTIKKDVGLKDNDIYKYHDIIQELSNMILIYEHFIFQRKIKPKNNHELLCFIIVQYIDKTIKRVKLNTFVHFIMGIFYKNIQYGKNIKKNNFLREQRYEKF